MDSDKLVDEYLFQIKLRVLELILDDWIDNK